MLRPVLLGLLFLAAPASADLAVTTCAQEVPPGEHAVLTTDLDCAGGTKGCFECAPGTLCGAGPIPCTTDADCPAAVPSSCTPRPAVALRAGSSLDLAGHRVSNAGSHVIALVDVAGRYAIDSSTGRGDVAGVSGALGCIVMASRGRLAVSRIDVHDCQDGIVAVPWGKSGVEATDVIASHNSSGIAARELRLTRVVASDNAWVGLIAGRTLRGTDVTVERNALGGAAADRFKLTRLTARNNGSATHAGGAGLIARSGWLVDSMLTDNLFTHLDVTFPLDLLTTRPPKLVNTMCGRSGGVGNVEEATWGVCAGD